METEKNCQRLQYKSERLSSSAGVAIGPILFVLALLGVLAAAMSTGGSNFQTASVTDRVVADITTQANLIRNTIINCRMQYDVALSMGSVSPVTADPPGKYPDSDPVDGTLVSALLCDPMGSGSLWSDILLPPPTAGFGPWMYMNAGPEGGRCLWTAPTGTGGSVAAGMMGVASRFNTSSAADSAYEAVYDPDSTSQKFIVWITPPTGTANAKCAP